MIWFLLLYTLVGAGWAFGCLWTMHDGNQDGDRWMWVTLGFIILVIWPICPGVIIAEWVTKRTVRWWLLRRARKVWWAAKAELTDGERGEGCFFVSVDLAKDGKPRRVCCCMDCDPKGKPPRGWRRRTEPKLEDVDYDVWGA